MSLHNFLIENSFYDPTNQKEKSDFLTHANIADAFIVNFIGLVALINLGQTAQLKSFINSIGPKIRYDNIEETNDDVSLSIKLFADVHGFTSVAARDSFTRLLAKIKTHTLTSIDEQTFRKLLQDCRFNVIKPSLLLLRTMDDFMSGTIDLNDLAETIYVNKNSARWSHIITEIRPAFIAAKTLIKSHRGATQFASSATSQAPVTVPSVNAPAAPAPVDPTSNPISVQHATPASSPKVPKFTVVETIKFVATLINASRDYETYGDEAEKKLELRLPNKSADEITAIREDIVKFRDRASLKASSIFESFRSPSEIYRMLSDPTPNFKPYWIIVKSMLGDVIKDKETHILRNLSLMFNGDWNAIPESEYSMMYSINDNNMYGRLLGFYEGDNKVSEIFKGNRPFNELMVTILSRISTFEISELHTVRSYVEKIIDAGNFWSTGTRFDVFKEKWENVSSAHPFVRLINDIKSRKVEIDPEKIYTAMKDYIIKDLPDLAKYFSVILAISTTQTSTRVTNKIILLAEAERNLKFLNQLVEIVIRNEVNFNNRLFNNLTIFPTIFLKKRAEDNGLFAGNLLVNTTILNSISEDDALEIVSSHFKKNFTSKDDYFEHIFGDSYNKPKWSLSLEEYEESDNIIFKSLGSISVLYKLNLAALIPTEYTRALIEKIGDKILNKSDTNFNRHKKSKSIFTEPGAHNSIVQMDNNFPVTNDIRIRVLLGLKVTEDNARELLESDKANFPFHPILPVPPLSDTISDEEMFPMDQLVAMNTQNLYRWFDGETGMDDNQIASLANVLSNTDNDEYKNIKMWILTRPSVVIEKIGEEKFFEMMNATFDPKFQMTRPLDIVSKLLDDNDDPAITLRYLDKIGHYIEAIFLDENRTNLITDEMLFLISGTPWFDKMYKGAGRKTKIKITKFKKLLKALDHLYDSTSLIKPAKVLSGTDLKKAFAFNNLTITDVTANGLAEQKAERVDRSREHFEKIEGEWYSKYWNSLHGRAGVKILDEFTVSLPHDAYDEFVKNFTNTMNPVWHGCGDVAASLITRYGFRVIPFDIDTMAGRALGDGIYFTNVVPKMLQYVRPNRSINRNPGVRGYIFELEAVLGSQRDYSAAGGDISNRFLSAEWCVFHPHAQLKFIKVYHAEIADVSHNKEMAIKHNLIREDFNKIGSFKEFIKEEVETDKPVHIAYFNFMDGMIVNSDLSTVPWTEFDAAKFGAEIHPAQNGIIIAKECSEKYAGFYVFPTGSAAPYDEEFFSWINVMFPANEK